MAALQRRYISSFSVQGLWGHKTLEWPDINADINLLVGINGSGKTTLLNLLNAYYTDNRKELKKYIGIPVGIPACNESYPIVYLHSFDTPLADKRKSDSPLMQALNNVVYQNKEGNSFFNYRMQKLDFPKNAMQIQENIDQLFAVINDMFADTGKTVDISRGNNSTLVFHQGETVLQLEQLSSGEKQLLLILLKVFLLNKQPAVVLMDEPEISLHLRWQREIIDKLRMLNPACQLIIATHSPGMFAAGWGDKVVYMEDLIK